MGIHLRTPPERRVDYSIVESGSYVSVKASVGSWTRHDRLPRTPHSCATRSLHLRLCAKAQIRRFDWSPPNLFLVCKTFRQIANVLEFLGVATAFRLELAKLPSSDNMTHVASKLEGFSGRSTSADFWRFGDRQMALNAGPSRSNRPC